MTTMNSISALFSKVVCSSDIEKRIDTLTTDALPYFNSVFKKLLRGNGNSQDAMILCEFITAEYINQNIKPSTKLTHIKNIC
jgi:hypothetical protein